MGDTKAQIRQFLSKSYRNHTFSDDEDIFAGGFVNSMFAMRLVTFVESTFGVSVETEDLDIANFSSITAIDRLVAKKRSGTG